MNSGKPRLRGYLYEFGGFRLDPSERTFAHNGQRISLAPKAFDTLLILVQHNGRVLTKEDLIKTLWPDRFVEENNLTQHISALRRVLGKEPGEFIETVPKLGYRFNADVREIDGDDTVAPGTADRTWIGEGEVVVSKRTSTCIVLREEEEEEVPDVPIPVVSPPVSRAARSAISSNWQMKLGLVAVVVAVGACAFLYRAVRPRYNADRGPTAPPAIAPVKPRFSVAVLGFKNLSGRTEDDWLSSALAEMLTTELSAGGQLRLVSGEEVHRIKSDLRLVVEQSLAKPTLDQIRHRVGADIIVSGTYVEVGQGADGQIRLDLQLQDVTAGETVFSTAVTGRTQELFALVSRCGAQLRSKLGVPTLSELEGAQDQAAMPSTPEVARYYSAGLYKLRTFDAPAAQMLLYKAVATDPNFALGHSALAATWSVLGYDENAKSEARRALDLSLSLSSQQHLLIAGQYSEFMRDWDQAVATYQQLVDLFPDSVDYCLLLANAQTSAGKGSQALATLGKLRNLPPPASQDPQIDLAQAVAADSLGDFKQELEHADRAIRMGTDLTERLLVARAWIKKGWALRRLGQTADGIVGLLEAKRLFAEAGDMQGVGSAMRMIGGAQQEQGDFPQAERSFQEAIGIFRRIGDRRSLAMSINGLAIAHYERGDYRAAKILDEQYLEIEREVGSKINTAGALGNIANVEDAQGNLADARRLNEDSIKIFTEVGDQRALGTALGNLATLLYEQGDLEGAKKKFYEALAIKQKIGYQRGIAYDLAGLSDALRAAGDVNSARQKQEEALTIRNQLGEKHNAAASQLSLAILDIEDQKPADAEEIAVETERQFESEKLAPDEAAAREVEARALLAQGKTAGAQVAIDRARNLLRRSSNLPLGFDIAATSARIRMARLTTAVKYPQNLSTLSSVKRDLESALSIARRCGYREYEYKLELALSELEVKFGNSHQGRAELEALAKESKERGFGLISRDASAILTERPMHHE